MTTLREAAQQALEALESVQPQNMGPLIHPAKQALRAALAQQQANPAQQVVRLRSALAEQMQKPSGSYTRWENTMCNPVGNPRTQQENAWHDGYASAKEEARLAPPQRKPLTEEEIIDATEHIDTSRNGYFIHIARAIERAHGIGGQDE